MASRVVAVSHQTHLLTKLVPEGSIVTEGHRLPRRVCVDTFVAWGVLRYRITNFVLPQGTWQAACSKSYYEFASCYSFCLDLPSRCEGNSTDRGGRLLPWCLLSTLLSRCIAFRWIVHVASRGRNRLSGHSGAVPPSLTYLPKEATAPHNPPEGSLPVAKQRPLPTLHMVVKLCLNNIAFKRSVSETITSGVVYTTHRYCHEKLMILVKVLQSMRVDKESYIDELKRVGTS